MLAATLSSKQQGPRTRLVYMSVDAKDADCLGAETVYQGGKPVGLFPDGQVLSLQILDKCDLGDGRVVGGHAAHGCIVRTTAEVLLALLPAWRFAR